MGFNALPVTEVFPSSMRPEDGRLAYYGPASDDPFDQFMHSCMISPDQISLPDGGVDAPSPVSLPVGAFCTTPPSSEPVQQLELRHRWTDELAYPSQHSRDHEHEHGQGFAVDDTPSLTLSLSPVLGGSQQASDVVSPAATTTPSSQVPRQARDGHHLKRPSPQASVVATAPLLHLASSASTPAHLRRQPRQALCDASPSKAKSKAKDKAKTVRLRGSPSRPRLNRQASTPALSKMSAMVESQLGSHRGDGQRTMRRHHGFDFAAAMPQYQVDGPVRNLPLSPPPSAKPSHHEGTPSSVFAASHHRHISNNGDMWPYQNYGQGHGQGQFTPVASPPNVAADGSDEREAEAVDHRLSGGLSFARQQAGATPSLDSYPSSDFDYTASPDFSGHPSWNFNISPDAAAPAGSVAQAVPQGFGHAGVQQAHQNLLHMTQPASVGLQAPATHSSFASQGLMISCEAGPADESASGLISALSTAGPSFDYFPATVGLHDPFASSTVNASTLSLPSLPSASDKTASVRARRRRAGQRCKSTTPPSPRSLPPKAATTPSRRQRLSKSHRLGSSSNLSQAKAIAHQRTPLPAHITDPTAAMMSPTAVGSAAGPVSASASAGQESVGEEGSSDGFVNFTPSDSAKILHGVAPSGSSKTKARREKEAQEKRARWEREAMEKQRKLSEAAVAAVRAAGGDITVLHGALQDETGLQRDNEGGDMEQFDFGAGPAKE